MIFESSFLKVLGEIRDKISGINFGTGGSIGNISVNLEGISQLKGEKGDIGIQGPKGDKGDIGIGWSVGDIKMVSHSSVDEGFIKGNGAEVSRIIYANLFSIYGTTYGDGDGINTFNLPDLRGYFPRFFDDGRGVDSGRVLGTIQLDQFQGHIHGINAGGNAAYFNGGSTYTGSLLVSTKTGIAVSDGTNGNPRIGTETRPINFSLMALIKY